MRKSIRDHERVPATYPSGVSCPRAVGNSALSIRVGVGWGGPAGCAGYARAADNTRLISDHNLTVRKKVVKSRMRWAWRRILRRFRPDSSWFHAGFDAGG